MENCERCHGPKPATRRFCKGCEKAVRSEMKESGYLQQVPWSSPKAPDAAGPRACGGGSWDNAVRAIEDG